jgi:peptidoglycan/xylan/chitin deacetylase (PgdA/CDA1 family)
MERPLILAYHAISASWENSLAVREEELLHHLTLLKRRGYEGLTFAQSELLRRQRRLPRRPLVITFDDGFASVLNARRIVAAAGYPATVFVVARSVELGKPLSWPGLGQASQDELAPLSWNDLESLVGAGWEVGSHTMSHPLLTRLQGQALERELAESRRIIARHVGSCETVAYPYGIADERVAQSAQAAGYTAGCVLVHSHRVDEPYRRPRVNIARGDSGLRLTLKLSPYYARLRRTRLAEVSDRVRIASGRGEWIPAR